MASVAQAQQPASPTTRPQKKPDEPLLVTFALAPERNAPVADTLPGINLRMYDPARRQIIDWGALGNLGSAARPMLFENPARRGFSTGVEAFDLYMLKPEHLGFYRNARSFSDVYFSQGRNQYETNLNARFARTFEGGLNFSLEYRTLNNLGQYSYQRDKHNALAAGFWVPLGKRYDGFLIFTQNVVRQQDNGGVVSTEGFDNGQFSGPASAEIRLPRQASSSRLDDRSLQLTQHLRLAGKGSAGRRTLRATHTFAWNRQRFKFSDPGSGAGGIGEDADFFEPLFVTDVRGLRHFLQVDRLDNAFSINTFKAKQAGRPSDLLAVGLEHRYFRVNQEPRKFNTNNVFATGRLALAPSTRFSFEAAGALGLLGSLGEYQLQGELLLGLGKAGELRASLLSQIRPPALIFERVYVSQRQVWDNPDFAKPLENTLAASYALPLIGLEVSARAHLLSNYLYFDQAGAAAQTTAPLQVSQLVLRENLRWGKLRFDNTLALQQPNRDDVLRLPTWFSKNSLYFDGKIFKKRMHLSTGVDFRINSEFRPDAYQPLLWQFHLQDEITQAPYPWLDVFVAFKVQTFQGFIRYENFGTLFDKTKVLQYTAWHPQPFGALRFGIAWRFMDDNLDEGGNNSSNPNSGGGIPSSVPIGRGRGF